jgi:hypothetical protein
MLKQRQCSCERLEIILDRYDSDEPHASPWRDGGEVGQVCRMISIPEGMTLTDGLRAVGGFTASELEHIGRAHPNPITASAFAGVFLGVALYLVVRSKNKPIVWLLAAGLIVVGVAPLVASTFLASRGIYHVRVIVLGVDNQPVNDAEINTSAGGEKKRTANGWEIDIPPQSKPVDGKVTVYAKAPNAFLAGEATFTLERDYFPTVEIRLAKSPSVTIHGDVLDDNQKAVADADVTLPDCSQSTKTDVHGLFALDSCVAKGQMVKIRAEKGKLSAPITVPAGDTVEIVVRKD